jgi:hypothetical protein
MKRDAMRQAAETFWNGQEQILHAMEEYANGWFERRHAGVDAALNASQQMIDAATPVEAVREYQKWAFGSIERIIDDGLSCQKHLLSMGGLLAPPLSPFGERTERDSARKSPGVGHSHAWPPEGSGGERQTQRMRDVERLPLGAARRRWTPIRGRANGLGGAGVQRVKTPAVHALE